MLFLFTAKSRGICRIIRIPPLPPNKPRISKALHALARNPASSENCRSKLGISARLPPFLR
jgi:hypothetical protein